MRILVTGAHGFIGSHLTERLLTDGHEVRALVSPWGSTDNLARIEDDPKLELRRADITNASDLTGICSGVEAVVHAAAKVADWGPAEPLMRANVEGTGNLLQEATAAGTKRFVLVSSVAVHRYSGYRNADPESVPRDNTSFPYALSKIRAEDQVLGWNGEGVVVRPGLWPFGPNDPQTRRVVTALRDRRLPLLDDGNRVLNTAFVGNLTLGLELAATTPGVGGRTFVIADAGAPTWKEALNELALLTGAPAPRLHVPADLVAPVAGLMETVWAIFAPRVEPPLTRYRASLMRRDVHFSLRKAETCLGYRPEVTWREGMAATVAQDPLLRQDGAR